MEVVGWHLGIPSSEVYGAATSYTELRVEEPGEVVARVCTALACAVTGADAILESLSAEFGVAAGGTSEDGLVTLEEARCGFLCAMAPAIEVSGKWHGRVDARAAIDLVRLASLARSGSNG